VTVVVFTVIGAPPEFTHELFGTKFPEKAPTRNTGEALSPCEFVEQPGIAATEMTARRTARRRKRVFIDSLLIG
jgi:hypothetical protein